MAEYPESLGNIFSNNQACNYQFCLIMNKRTSKGLQCSFGLTTKMTALKVLILFLLENVVKNKVSKRQKIVTYYGMYGIHKINSLYGLLLANHSMYCLSLTQVIGLCASHVLQTSRFLAKLRYTKMKIQNREKQISVIFFRSLTLICI